MNVDDVDMRLADIQPGARVSSLAAVGAPAEWIGRSTDYPAIIHSGAVVREFATVTGGTTGPTIVGPGALVMTGARVSHDVVIGAGARLCMNSVVCGLASVGDGAIVYSGAVVCPSVNVGDGAILAANSVATRDIPAREVWGGAPARFIRPRS